MKYAHCWQAFFLLCLIALLPFHRMFAQDTERSQQSKIPVKTSDDLPRHTYKVSGTAVDILSDPMKFDPLLDQWIADLENDLEKYEIPDPMILREYHLRLSNGYWLKRDWEKALAHGSGNLLLEATVAGYNAAPDLNDPKFIESFRKTLKSRLASLPMGESLKGWLITVQNQAKTYTRQSIEAGILQVIEPQMTAAKGELSANIVNDLVRVKQTLDWNLATLPHCAAIAAELLDAHSEVEIPASKWEPRLVELSVDVPAKPINIAIWDSGVDLSLYEANLWSNEAEAANGKDDDGNGFIDDLHGFGFDHDRYPTTESLIPLNELRERYAQFLPLLQANEDLQRGISSEYVRQYEEFRRGLQSDNHYAFVRDLSRISLYVHGSHTAGIAIAGNPFARIVNITDYFSVENPSIEIGHRWSASFKQAGEYLRKAEVRIVNMSWHLSQSHFEIGLQSRLSNAEERAELSREIFKPIREGLEETIRSAPDILFICGAGNEGNDVDFAGYIPASLRLPNLIVVGAVDDQDNFTEFTSTGKNVDFYANGYRIESRVPGGRLMKLSGTSPATPQVANLAAKILALRPELKPTDVIALIRKHADPISNHPGRFIIHPKKTIESLQVAE